MVVEVVEPHLDRRPGVGRQGPSGGLGPTPTEPSETTCPVVVGPGRPATVPLPSRGASGGRGARGRGALRSWAERVAPQASGATLCRPPAN